MGQVSWMPVGMEDKGEDGQMPLQDPKFISKSDSDMVFDNDPCHEHDLEEMFGKGNKSLKDTD